MDLNIFDRYVDQGYIRKVISPCKKLVLFNYTDKCVFEKKWNKITLGARGTVYEISTGKVVAQSFKKFFNYGELPASKARNLLKKTDFKVYDKLDGSLGIVYFYDGKWRVNTRGSFTSDQAIKATQMLEKYNFSSFGEGNTFLVEIIYPENKIILDYGSEEKLVLLGSYLDNFDHDFHLNLFGECLGMEVAQNYQFQTIQELIDIRKTLPLSKEGFVVRFKDGYRVKFKGEEYLKIARLLSGFSPLTLWESMKDTGKVDQNLLMQLPEEFRGEYETIAKKLNEAYSEIQVECHISACHIYDKLEFAKATTPEKRKALGLFLKENEMPHSKVMFPYFLGDHEGIRRYIHQLIRPNGNVLKQ